MTNEKILEIANRYTAPETESRILFDKDGNATGGTYARHRRDRMTFEEYMSDHFGCDDPSYAAATYSKVWTAAQKAERERIKKIVDEVGWHGIHDKWFECADAIAERIGE